MGLKERFVRFRSFWIFPTLAIILLTVSHRWDSRSWSISFPAFFLSGLGLWTILEYGLHRFVFHIRLRNRALQATLNGTHLQHHAKPRDPDLILVHPWFGLGVSAFLYAILFLVFRAPFAPAAILSGTWAGFLYYEAVHYRVHRSLAGSPLLQNQRRAHFYHHFSDVHSNFGVTSTLWDYVFGTRLPLGK